MWRRFFLPILFFSFAALFSPAVSAQGLPQERPGKVPVDLGTIRVNVRNATGAPLDTQAVVRLRQRVGSIQMTGSTLDNASVEFRQLPVGDYVIEVFAASYQPATEETTLYSATSVTQVYILLRPESAPATTVAGGVPLLAPKAEKEVQEAVRALGEDKLGEAEKHLQRAEKLAPGHPEIQYLFGILYARKNNPALARQRFEKAIEIYPQHAGALSALAKLLLQDRDLVGAAGALERALVADARSQENHALLALVLFQQENFEKARYHAEQALDLTGGNLPETTLLFSQILIALKDPAKAAQVLEKFLREYPGHAAAPSARNMLAQLQAGTLPSPTSQRQAAPPARADAGGSSERKITKAGAHVLSLASLAPELAPGAELAPAREWYPEDVDAEKPAIFRDVRCPVDTVLQQSSRRVVDLIDNLGDVNAAEAVSHTSIDARGRLGRTETAGFEYMFSYRREKPGVLWVEEFRDGNQDTPMVGGVATSGFAAMALVFHPYYAGDFEMTCEGQGSWRGQPVWYVHFRQKEDVAPRMRRYTASQGSAMLRFKGRAWIAANTYQIVRIETDLIDPPRNLRFEREHMVIEYRAVRFTERKDAFWLPASVDIYAQENGRRWHRNHSLSKFVHFAVDTRQRVAEPEIPNEAETPAATKPPPGS